MKHRYRFEDLFLSNALPQLSCPRRNRDHQRRSNFAEVPRNYVRCTLTLAPRFAHELMDECQTSRGSLDQNSRHAFLQISFKALRGESIYLEEQPIRHPRIFPNWMCCETEPAAASDHFPLSKGERPSSSRARSLTRSYSVLCRDS